MLLEEIKNIKSEKKDLRNFGITFGVVLGLLGGALWWKGRDTYALFLMLSVAFFLAGLIVPVLLKPLQKIWMTIAVVIGWFMTRVILGVLFYTLFSLIGLIARCFGKKFLETDFRDGRQSYWIKRDSVTVEKSRYEKQF